MAILIFAVGWEAGLVMSPYYTATPIIFEDHVAVSPLPNSYSVPASTATQIQGKYVASKNSTLFHDASCAGAKSIKLENQVWFASLEEAKASGRTASSCTTNILKVK